MTNTVTYKTSFRLTELHPQLCLERNMFPSGLQLLKESFQGHDKARFSLKYDLIITLRPINMCTKEIDITINNRINPKHPIISTHERRHKNNIISKETHLDLIRGVKTHCKTLFTS